MYHRLACLLAFCLQAVFGGPRLMAQQSYTHQFSLVNENDNYTFTYTDHYYTNGIMMRYVQAAPEKAGAAKRTLTLEAGQMIFTPFTFSLSYRKFMDRPFTGYLYTKVLRTHINHKGQLMQWGALTGVIGKKAFGQEVQRWHHRTWGLKYPYGWEHQLKTGVGLNLEARFIQPFLSLGSQRFGLKMHGSGQAQVGNLFMQAATGMLLRLGAAQPTASTAAFDTRVSRSMPGRQMEWYLFYEPQVTAQWYNATLQGILWKKAANYFTATPAPWVYQQKLGFVYAPERWSAQVAFTHKSKEALTQHAKENWGTIALGYRW